ncbi:adenylate kinase [bacterium]|nr:adenylate kinase [bacterium]
MRIVFLGAPGSGKGTQAEKLMTKYDVPHISTGDLLRAAVADGTELGKKAKTAMDAGELVSDDIVIGMIRERLKDDDAQKGFILDGFPRSHAQAAALDEMLAQEARPLEKAVHLAVDNDEIMSRLMARKRADDNEETIRHRLKVYEDQTHPVINYYAAQAKLATVTGIGNMDEIFGRIEQAIGV